MAGGFVLSAVLHVAAAHGDVLRRSRASVECQWLVLCGLSRVRGSTLCLGGKCSICGEPYDKPVKMFERGGEKYKGTIVKTYNQGEQIDVKVVVSEFVIERESISCPPAILADGESQGLFRIPIVQLGRQSSCGRLARMSRSSLVKDCQY